MDTCALSDFVIYTVNKIIDISDASHFIYHDLAFTKKNAFNCLNKLFLMPILAGKANTYMKKTSINFCLLITLLTASLLSCRKNGLDSPTAKKIQYRWERISSSSVTDYLDGRAIYWTTTPIPPGYYIEFNNNGYFYDISSSSSTKYEYKVDGDKILSLLAGLDRFTTPQYTDTAFIKQADDHLLVLFRRKYFISGAYSQMNEYLDSLKR